MKLTDEQKLRMRSEIRANLSAYDFQISQMDANGLSLRVDAWKRMYVKHVDFLLSSEQAWKEKSDHMESLANEACKEANELRDQLNQAIEVLKFYAEKKHLSKHYGEDGQRARDFISSLNKEET